MSQSFQPGDQVIWWKRITAVVDYPYSATVLAADEKRVRILVDVPETSADTLTRFVAADRLQPVGVYYKKATDQGPMICEPMKSWGKLTRYLEIGEDLWALRHVDVFENRKLLSYDRAHWVDNFGTLADARIRRNRSDKHWGRSVEIEPAEFVQVWDEARRAATWREQTATAMMSRLGTIPLWLTITRPWQAFG